MRRTDCPTPNFSTVTGLAMMLREYTRGDVIQKAHARHTTSRDRLPRSRVRMPRGRSLRPARCSDQARRRNALGALRDALPGVVRSRRVVGQITPFWVLYALHDALVKPMPGNQMTPSLA